MFASLPDEVFSTPQFQECRQIIFPPSKTHVLEGRHTVTQELASAIHTLWTDDDVRAATSLLDRSTAHFLDRILHIGSPDYVPTDSDILRCKRHAPPAIEEISVKYFGWRYSLICPRQPVASKHKWLPSFEGVFRLIFVFNLDDYDKPVCFHCLCTAVYSH